MSDMGRCHCCGVKQSGYQEHNREYERLLNLILETGDERQLVDLIGIMQDKITTGVTNGSDANKLAYPDKELLFSNIILNAAIKLHSKLSQRQ